MTRPIEYLQWHVAHATDRRFDLATSDQHAIAGEPADDDDVVPSILSGVSAPPGDVSIESQLAELYGVDRDQVLLTAGASHANFLAFAAARSDGDRVVVESPGYEPLVATPEWLGMDAARFDRLPGDDYALDPDALDAALDRETALAVVTNRHNPSGRQVNRAALAAAAERAQAYGARLHVDEVFAPFGVEAVDGPFGGPSAAGLAGTVVTGSLTKLFGLGDLRVGWLIADEPFVARARAALHHVPTISGLTVDLGKRALHHHEELAEQARDRVRANHDLLSGFVSGRDDLTGPVFDGATLGFLSHDAADGDTVTETGLEEDLVVVPGRFFDDPHRVRVSLSKTPAVSARALQSFQRALDSL